MVSRANLYEFCVGRYLNKPHGRDAEVITNNPLALGLVGFTGNGHAKIGERMKGRLFVIVDHPSSSVGALDMCPEELLAVVALAISRSTDDSFNKDLLVLLAHMVAVKKQGC
jgi:hypothetical protein